MHEYPSLSKLQFYCYLAQILDTSQFLLDRIILTLPTPPVHTEGSGRFDPKADMSKVTCHCCNCKGHYTNSCTSKTGHLHSGKSPSGVETGLSHSTINNPTNVPNGLPDCLPPASERQIAPPDGADHSPDKADLFIPDTGYSGNALHCVIVEDIHVVQTHSQARAEGEAQAVVSKPYAHQLLDKAPNKGPSLPLTPHT
ncbi:hypothetical protein DSO57_1000264 [Entomophthora muscae]|uniref:Uncharacterized protein n=1 Tax=Entomophthora muscae TaxID=34485 RepID=A0ACC2SZ22_9FUNG|nr:hypothetical protein DSO57_1000264 [Entomophthora muscae]